MVKLVLDMFSSVERFARVGQSNVLRAIGADKYRDRYSGRIDT